MSSSAVAIDRGRQQAIHDRPGGPATNFRESLVAMAAAPWRRLRRLGGHGTAATDFWALRDVSFDVRVGEVVGIIGPNGAGKSTLLKILSRITPPTTGHIDLDGRVSSLLEVGTGFHPELTGRENIFLNGAILGMTARGDPPEVRRDRRLRRNSSSFIDTPVKHYSSGMYVRLAFSVAAHLEPEILIVDEVLAVGDLHFRNRCLGRMREMRDEGRTVLFVSHDLTSVRQLCNRAVMLLGGRVDQDGSPDEVTRRYEQMNRDPSMAAAGALDRVNPPPHYHLRRVELRNAKGAITRSFDAGDVLEIHLWSSERAPADSFTVEFKLLNDNDELISFGAANPVRDTYFQASQQHFVCRLGPLPLTEGGTRSSFTVRVWNQSQWDFWEKAIGFDIQRCDLFGTGHGVSNLHDGDFVIQQEWLAGD